MARRKKISIDPEISTLEYCLKNIKDIYDDMSTLNNEKEDAFRFYRGDADIVPYTDGSSKVTTKDLQDLIEWAMPSLLDIFTSDTEVISLKPQGLEDTEAVRNQDVLINYQIKSQNPWFKIVNSVVRDGLMLRTGAVKVTWGKEVVELEKSYEDLTDEEYFSKLQEDNIEVVSHKEEIEQEEVVDMFGIVQVPSLKSHDLTLKYRFEREMPKIVPIMSENIGFPIDTCDIEDAKFVYCKVLMPKYEFTEKYGKEKADLVNATLKDLEGNTWKGHPVTQQRYEDLGGLANFFYDKTRDEYIVYECYYRNRDTGKPWVTVLCGEEILSDEENKYGSPPFEIFSPILDAHRVIGQSFYDLIVEIQKQRTMLVRQIMNNVYKSNNGRFFVDPSRINLNDLANSTKPFSIVRTIGDPSSAVMPEPNTPLSPFTFNLLEMINMEKDYHSGVPRAFQGVNKEEFNKTWRGQAQQVQQASMRINLIARIFAETFLVPLVKRLVKYNIQFMEKKTAIRVLNTFVEITPDNILGFPDVIVNVGVGNADKQQTILYMQQLLGIYAQASKAGSPVVTSDNVYAAMRELVKAMGYRNIDDFVTNPQLVQKLNSLMVYFKNMAQQAIQMGMQIPPEVGQLYMDVERTLNVGQQAQQIEQGGGGEQSPQPAQPMQPTNMSQGGNFG
jgi:hypothetical protein